MKVLHLISGGDTGGAKTAVLSLCQELSKYIQCDIVCFIQDSFYEEGLARGINIKVYEQKKRSDLGVLKKLKALIEQENYDLIHCHGARANFVGMFLKWQVKKTFVTTIHSDYRLDFKGIWYKQILYMPLNAIALRQMDKYIAVSRAFKEMLLQRGFRKEDVFTVYNGVNPEDISVKTSKAEFLERYGVPNDDKVIVGMAARLDNVKNPDMFINMAYLALQKNEHLRFLIAGEGGERAHLENRIALLRIEDSVKLLGFVEDKYGFFESIDINVLTSNSESFPYVIMEGALLGKPAITTDVGGLGDLIENGKNSFLIPPGNDMKMAEYVTRLSENEKVRTLMGERLKQKVMAEFTLQRMGETHIKIYQRILKEATS